MPNINQLYLNILRYSTLRLANYFVPLQYKQRYRSNENEGHEIYRG